MNGICNWESNLFDLTCLFWAKGALFPFLTFFQSAQEVIFVLCIDDVILHQELQRSETQGLREKGDRLARLGRLPIHATQCVGQQTSGRLVSTHPEWHVVRGDEDGLVDL